MSPKAPLSMEELIETVGICTKPPPTPFPKIPNQWLPGFIRWPIRIIVLPFVLLDLTARWIARKMIPTPFKKVGKCKKRGNCCYYILIPEPRGLLCRFFYFWSTQINGFYQRHPKPIDDGERKMVVMGCRYLKKNGQCAHYHLRPMGCRQWPAVERFGIPKILKGCGYKIERRD